MTFVSTVSLKRKHPKTGHLCHQMESTHYYHIAIAVKLQPRIVDSAEVPEHKNCLI